MHLNPNSKDEKPRDTRMTTQVKGETLKQCTQHDRSQQQGGRDGLVKTRGIMN